METARFRGEDTGERLAVSAQLRTRGQEMRRHLGSVVPNVLSTASDMRRWLVALDEGLPLPVERSLFLLADATLPGMIVLLGAWRLLGVSLPQRSVAGVAAGLETGGHQGRPYRGSHHSTVAEHP